MDQNTQNSTPSLPGVIYVGRTEGEHCFVLGKVGAVENPEFLEGRVVSYRVADRIFRFVLEAAYAVELTATISILNVEAWVHSYLEGLGLMRFGENFSAPDGNMLFLARQVEEALTRLGHKFASLDVDALQARAREQNSRTWQKLRKGKQNKKGERCPYNAWLEKQCEAPQSLVTLARPRNYVRHALALGYLIRDLAVGSNFESIQVPLYRGGNLKIYPTSLEAGLFEAKAEADLSLASTTSFSACPNTLEQIPTEPYAMTLLLGSNLEMMEIPNTFLAPTKDRPEEVRMSPDHLAALGLLGGKFDEHCLYEGLGVRAKVPMELYPLILHYHEELPGIRFWLGLQHCAAEGLRIQDFTLPWCLGPLWEQAAKAAKVMAQAGCPVPQKIQEWVAHRWIPSRI